VLSVVKRAAAAFGGVLLVALVAWLAWLWNDSRLPATYNVMDYGTAEYGGGQVPPGGHDHYISGGVSVADLRGPAGKPDERFTLVAERASIRLPSGRSVDALTFNGHVPGPELRVRQGDLVEVRLVNRDVSDGVTIHWHGVDVPNAEDGAAGITQNAVLPGQTYTYRFVAKQQGTFWYHTHEYSSKNVRQGLFGALVIDPPGRHVTTTDLSVLAHELGGEAALDGSTGVVRRTVRPGEPVRLRLVNTNNTPRQFVLSGTPFRVAAIDGTDLGNTPLIRGSTLELAAGGRYDVAFTMAARRVSLTMPGAQAALVLSPNASRPPPASAEGGPLFDPLAYGRRTTEPSLARGPYDRSFMLSIGRKPGFLDGRPGFQWTLNGGIYADVPVFVVRKGDRVRVTIANHTSSVHPMHLHGHHALVLSRDGVPATGAPWWTDTLNVKPGETYVVAFLADNPGLWMDHCHNLRHAARGLTMHVVYEGVTSPFEIGGPTNNNPE
jgi:FtsP/CotA-like multicopper oxidase with cupredoxin domain